MRVLATIVLAGVAAAQDPAVELERLVDLPTLKERRRYANELSVRSGVSLAQWVAAATRFGSFLPVEAGVRTLRVAGVKISRYVPPSYRPDRAAPLLLSSHSTSMPGPSAYAQWRRVADRLGMIVVAPWSAEPTQGYGFKPADRQIAWVAMRWARRTFHIDEDRVYLTGWGRGGHATWDLALRARDRFAAIAPLSGAPCMVTSNGANNRRYLDNVIDLPIRCVADQSFRMRPMYRTVPSVFEQLRERGAKDARLIVRERGKPAGVVWDAFFTKRRVVKPRRVVRAYARRGEGRAFWVEVWRATSRVKENFRLVATAAQAKGMDDLAYWRFMQRKADEKTARLEVTMTKKGMFVANGTFVRAFRILLDETMFENGKPITVEFNGTTFRRTPRPNSRILLEEFAARFDRTFLPIADVRIP